MSLMPPYDYQHEDKKQHPSHHSFNVFGYQGVGQYPGHLVNLVTDAYEHKRGQDDIEKWLARNQDQNSLGIVGKPDMVLRYKQLQTSKNNQHLMTGREGNIEIDQSLSDLLFSKKF